MALPRRGGPSGLRPAAGRAPTELALESATAAVRCAQALAATTASSLGLQLRTGIHCGEVECRDGDVRGIAVAIAARIVALAAPGEVLCSGTVTDLAVGSELQFAERLVAQLKGDPRTLADLRGGVRKRCGRAG